MQHTIEKIAYSIREAAAVTGIRRDTLKQQETLIRLQRFDRSLTRVSQSFRWYYSAPPVHDDLGCAIFTSAGTPELC